MLDDMLARANFVCLLAALSRSDKRVRALLLARVYCPVLCFALLCLRSGGGRYLMILYDNMLDYIQVHIRRTNKKTSTKDGKRKLFLGKRLFPASNTVGKGIFQVGAQRGQEGTNGGRSGKKTKNKYE